LQPAGPWPDREIRDVFTFSGKRHHLTMNRQLNLFEGASPARESAATAVSPSEISSEERDLYRLLSSHIRLGTSSWHFPGWRGLMWNDTYLPGDLSRYGLPAYATHPLLRAVGLDRSFYAPLPARQYAIYAAQVPQDFRFLVKAPGAITSAWEYLDNGQRTANSRFLDLPWAIDQFVAPAVEGLQSRAGPLLFQFPPLGRAMTRAPERFIAQLHDFLAGLPKGPLYAVEMRDDRLINRRFFTTLHETGVRYCISVHPRMPAVAAQAAAMSGFGLGPLVIRWNLQPGHTYEEAKKRFTPFDQLIAEDTATRESIAQLCAGFAGAGQDCYVIVNNKAEGCAPLSVMRLGEEIVGRMRER
jgi:uncharacterized protein YecE (DUF72 family)